MPRLRFTDLSSQSYDFVMGNLKLLVKYLIFILPPIMAMEALIRLEPDSVTPFVSWGILIFKALLFACFALAWHRASLMGPDSLEARLPFQFRRWDWKFFCAFFLIAAFSTIMLYTIRFIVEHQLINFPRTYRVIGEFLALLSMFFVFYETVKASYFLPPLSMGVGLKFSDVRRSARGTIRPLIRAILFFGLIYFVVVGVYSYVSLAVIASVTGQPVTMKPAPQAPLSATVTVLFLNIPLYLAAFLAYAMCITALSKAYRFGVQNNA